MSSQVVLDAVRDRLVADDVAGQGWPVVDWQDVDALLDTRTEPLIAVEGEAAQERRASIGTTPTAVRESGFVPVHLIVPSTTPPRQARQWRDLVRDALADRWLSAAIRTTSADAEGYDLTRDRRWSVLTTSVAYTYDHERS